MAENKEYLKRHPHISRKNCAKRRSKLKAAFDSLSNSKIIDGLYDAARRVSDCTGVGFHVDHIVPLSLGGKHHQGNLCLLPQVINARKGARIDFDLVPYLGFDPLSD